LSYEIDFQSSVGNPLKWVLKNPKSEYRNPKQIQNSNFRIVNVFVWKISVLNIHSCFGFRLPSPKRLPAAQGFGSRGYAHAGAADLEFPSPHN
jgi:hypothetical protein